MVKGLGQSQKFGFGMKFYVGSADDLPLSERVMPGLVAVAWAEGPGKEVAAEERFRAT